MSGENGKVVVVDDVTETQDLVVEALESHGFDVEKIPSREVRSYGDIKKRVRDPVAYVMDIYMEGTLDKGVRLLRQISDNDPTKPVLAVSLLFFLVESADNLKWGSSDYTAEELEQYAEEVRAMEVFQRHPNWVVPKDYGKSVPAAYYNLVPEVLRRSLANEAEDTGEHSAT